MTRVGYGDLLGITNARWGKGAAGVTWLLRATFGGGDQAAPLPSPLGAPAVEVGSLTLSNAALFNITSGSLRAESPDSNRLASSSEFSAVSGLAVIAAPGAYYTGWYSGAPPVTFTGMAMSVKNNQIYTPENGSNLVNLLPVRSIEATRIAIVLTVTGASYFRDHGGVWERVWQTNTTLASYTVRLYTYFVLNAVADELGVRQLSSPMDSADGMATQNVASPVSGASYTATANAITDLTLTAPNPLADSAGYRYRYTDDDNCWHSYFNDAGAYRLDSVAASVATNRINVAAVIAAAGTATMRTISSGSLHDAYTLAATTWTKRGTQINVSHLNTNTAIRPYVTGSWAMSNLRSYPVTDPRYDAELNKT